MGIFFLILGFVLGSFYLVIGTRLPKGENVITDRSRCDHCKEVLRWYELIPVFSYVFLKGRCHHCGKKISIEHLIVELATGFLFLVGYLYLGLTLKYAIYLL